MIGGICWRKSESSNASATRRGRDEANAKLDLARVRIDEAIQQTKDLIELYRKQKP